MERMIQKKTGQVRYGLGRVRLALCLVRCLLRWSRWSSGKILDWVAKLPRLLKAVVPNFPPVGPFPFGPAFSLYRYPI